MMIFLFQKRCFCIKLLTSSFLSSGVEGFREDSEITGCDWSDLAILLWMGQTYE